MEQQLQSIQDSHTVALQQKEIELTSLKNPENNLEIVALREKLAASSAKNKSIAKEANEKLKARSATIKELQDQIEILKKVL